MANARQGAQQLGPVLSHPPSVGVRGSWTNGRVEQQRRVLQENPRFCIDFLMSLPNGLSFSSRPACAPCWCQRFVVPGCHAVSPDRPGFGEQKRRRSPLPAHTRRTAMGGRDHRRRFDSPSTVTYFNQNGRFFNYFPIMCDAAPLACELF